MFVYVCLKTKMKTTTTTTTTTTTATSSTTTTLTTHKNKQHTFGFIPILDFVVLFCTRCVREKVDVISILGGTPK